VVSGELWFAKKVDIISVIMKNEIEATFLSVNKNSTREKLKKSGFKLEIPEYLMRRKTFKFSRVASGCKKWGRVRQESNKVTMTIKEIRGLGINDTYEIELIVDDFDTACNFFEACGILVQAFQENMREVWVRDEIEVAIDTWPGLNSFLEIEGPSENLVQKVSDELDFDLKQAIFGSIDLVYEKELGIPSKKIISLPEITFANPPKKKVV